MDALRKNFVFVTGAAAAEQLNLDGIERIEIGKAVTV